jgi:CRISPR-associated protein Cas6
MQIDLVFPVLGDTIPIDHAYPLYGAISRLIPAIHSGELPARFAPIRGMRARNATLKIVKESVLRLRVAADHIPKLLPLSGRQMALGSQNIRLGAPMVYSLEPAPELQARIITFKNSTEPQLFLETARRKLAELEITGEVSIPIIQRGPRANEPIRRIIRIREKKIVGFATIVRGLSPEHSIQLQELGLGGRQRMGCGFFGPHKSEPGTGSSVSSKV